MASKTSTKHACENPTISPATSSYRIPPLEDVLNRYPTISGVHPACAAVPSICETDFNELAVAMKRYGQLDPIKIDANGMLLDGRNRLSVAFLLQLEPRLETVLAEPWAVASSNIARRHLTVGQRAAFAAARLDSEQLAASERRRANLKKGKESPVCQNSDTRSGRATEKVAKEVGVSRDSVEKYKNLPAESQGQVKAGKLSLHAATSAAGLTKQGTQRLSKAKSEEVSERLGCGDIEFESANVLVLGHSDLAPRVVVIGSESGIWHFQCTDSDKRYKASTRAKAIERGQKKLSKAGFERALKALVPE